MFPIFKKLNMLNNGNMSKVRDGPLLQIVDLLQFASSPSLLPRKHEFLLLLTLYMNKETLIIGCICAHTNSRYVMQKYICIYSIPHRFSKDDFRSLALDFASLNFTWNFSNKISLSCISFWTCWMTFQNK